MQLKIKIGDVFVLTAIIVAAIIVFLSFYQPDSQAKIAVIIQNNEVLERISLDQLTDTIYIKYEGNYPGVIEAKNGSIRFCTAECPDQVCVETGWISRPGHIAVCLPAGVIIKIEGENSDFDVIIQ
ncbi:MAG: NusG domain II-containing protein [Clostridiaceae bacterium]|nr:NusG domain II-containing protein [Clostridiaceae bacterium]